MGSDASKPLQPPTDWSQNDGDEFRIISPMSDISNPSDIHRVYHAQPIPKTDPRRRRSRTVTKAMKKTSSNSHSDLPAPASFYFPTKETERLTDRISSYAKGKENQSKNMKKNLKSILKVTKKSMAGCLAPEEHRKEIVKLEELDLQKKKEAMRQKKKKEASSRSQQGQRKTRSTHKQIQKYDTYDASHRVIRKQMSNISEGTEESSTENVTLGISDMALHQEDAYFDRLNGYAQASPMVQNQALKQRGPRVSDIVQKYQSRESTISKTSSKASGPSVANLAASSSATNQIAFDQMLVEANASNKAQMATASSIPVDPLKQVATLGKSRSAQESIRRDTQKVSKLESLFRPILPALSADDAHSIASYDPFEIKVTESAPAQIEGGAGNQLAVISPSMVSIDSQSPSKVKVLLSHQAVKNGEFLFSAYGKEVLQQRANGNKDSDVFSISTHGARSRVSQRSANAVAISKKKTGSYASSSSSRGSERQVRFSIDNKPATFEIPGIESKVSDLTDNASESGRFSDNATPPIIEEPIEEENGSPEEQRVRWAYSAENGVTPFAKGKSIKNVTNSPYVRFQAAKSKWQSKDVATEIPPIQKVVSDLTDPLSEVEGRPSTGSSDSNDESQEESPEKQEENDFPQDEEVVESPEVQVNWKYTDKGVTPYLNKGENETDDNGAESPFSRFRTAKTKFTSTKEVPAKSPRNLKIKRKGAGGVVTARIEALDRKVIENRRLKRTRQTMKKSMMNPRRFQNVNTTYLRNQRLNGYKATKLDVQKLNMMGAAKFNALPTDDGVSDDDLSSILSPVAQSKARGDIEMVEYSPSEETSTRRSSTDSATVTTVTTVVQQRGPAAFRASESTYSTSASSGFLNVKKQVFDNRGSLASAGDSTTLSSILGKENDNFLPFRTGANAVKPTEQKMITLPKSLELSPGPAKWRSLAAAAQEKNTRKGLSDLGNLNYAH